jgi:hypothetical protein
VASGKLTQATSITADPDTTVMVLKDVHNRMVILRFGEWGPIVEIRMPYSVAECVLSELDRATGHKSSDGRG